MEILLGPWRPDLSALGSPCTVAKNVLAAAKNVQSGAVTYKQFRSFANTISALSARVRGAAAIKEIGGGAHIYAGTDTGLYQLAPGGTSFTDRSKSGGYSCADDETWTFQNSPDGTSIYAANIADAIQAATAGSSSAFADLSASAPKCRRMAVWGPHLVTGNVLFGGTDYPNRLHWCGQTNGVGDPTSWPTIGSVAAAQARSDKRDLEGGAIVGLTQGEFGGSIVTERKIYYASLVESSLIFDIQPVEQNRGSRFPGTVAGVGRLVFFYNDDGFWMFNGVESVPIGTQKIDAWFQADLDTIYIPRVCSVIDPVNKLYIVGYPGSGHTAGDLNKVIIFNWSPAVQEWTYLDLTGANLEFLFQAMNLGYTLDSLDDIGLDIDSLPFSLDSYVWQGGAPLLGAFDTSHRMGFFTGSAMAARLTTGERQLSAGQRSRVTSRTPYATDVGTTVTVSDLTRKRLQGSSLTTWGPFALTADGECPGDSDDRYHRFQMDITGGFTDATGVDVTAEGSGAY